MRFPLAARRNLYAYAAGVGGAEASMDGSDTSAREWLDGFVRAHDPTVPQAERRVVAGARARGALDGAHGPAPMRRIVIDLELEEGAEAARPILLD